MSKSVPIGNDLSRRRDRYCIRAARNWPDSRRARSAMQSCRRRLTDGSAGPIHHRVSGWLCPAELWPPVSLICGSARPIQAEQHVRCSYSVRGLASISHVLACAMRCSNSVLREGKENTCRARMARAVRRWTRDRWPPRGPRGRTAAARTEKSAIQLSRFDVLVRLFYEDFFYAIMRAWRERAAGACRESDRLPRCERFAQGTSFMEREDQEEPAVLGLGRVDQADNAGVVQPCQHGSLATKALAHPIFRRPEIVK